MPPKRAQVRSLQGLLGADAPDLSRAGPGEGSLAVTSLHPNPEQPRRVFHESALQELAASIREHGVLQPLLVRPVAAGFEIVAGERRWRAAQLAGLQEVPVLIRELDDMQARVAALLENLQRENLSVIEEVDAKLQLVALALAVPVGEARGQLMRLLKQADDPQVEALERVFAGLGEGWQSFTKNKLRVLNWPPALLNALREGLPYSTVGLLASVDARQHAPLLDLIRAGATQAEVRREIERLNTQLAERPRAALVGRVLTSRRFLAGLDEKQARQVDAWLAKAPEVVRAALERAEAHD